MGKKKKVTVVFELNTEFEAESREDLRAAITVSREMLRNFTPVRIYDENKNPIMGESQTDIVGYDTTTDEPIFNGDQVLSCEQFIMLKKNFDKMTAEEQGVFLEIQKQ